MRRAALAVLAAVVLGGGAAPVAGQAAGDPLVDLEPIGMALVTAETAGAPGFGGISGLAWDEATQTFLAVSDAKDQPRLYRLRVTLADPRADGEDGGDGADAAPVVIEVVERIDLPGEPSDAEGICAAPGGGWLVSYEGPATVVRLDAAFGEVDRSDGAAAVGRALTANKAWEGITVHSFEGETRALVISELGAPASVRGWRERSTALWLNLETLDEAARGVYVLAPGPVLGITGLSGLAALPAGGGVLALERRAVVPTGFDAAVFLAAPSRAADGSIYFQKAPLGALSEMGLPWVGNLEGMAVGPEIDDRRGGRLLLLAADDNFGRGLQRGTQFVALRLLDARGQVQGPRR